MIGASVVLATLLVAASPTEQPSAAFDTTYPVAQSDARAEQFPQPGVFDPTRFDSATVVALRAMFDSAAAQSLPTKPLINFANQGASRGASRTKIISAVREHFHSMLDARVALGANATESELDTGADAIKKGAETKTLQQIRKERPARGGTVSALVVLTDLMERGIQSNKARDAILSLARASSTDEAINGLQVMVARNAERGPGMAQDALDRYVRSNVSGAKNAPKAGTRPPPPPDAP